MRFPVTKRYGFLWVTLFFFVFSLAGHWIFSWHAYKQEQIEHGHAPETKDYLIETARDTFENWQSEFLQLIWQVAGLAFLFFVGSPQSKEGDDRKEEKMDYLIKLLDPENGEKEIRRLDKKWPRTQ